MDERLHGTIRVPAAGVVLEIVTRSDLLEKVQLHASRFGMWQLVELGRDEAEQLAIALCDALNTHAAGAPS